MDFHVKTTVVRAQDVWMVACPRAPNKVAALLLMNRTMSPSTHIHTRVSLCPPFLMLRSFPWVYLLLSFFFVCVFKFLSLSVSLLLCLHRFSLVSYLFPVSGLALFLPCIVRSALPLCLHLAGTIPAALGRLNHLTHLRLSFNSFTGDCCSTVQ